MTGFSQPERRGLQQMQSKPEVHPDADLLTAFSEQALTTREREQVMSHLAVCSTCRDVVSLAAPAHPIEAQLPNTAKTSAFWRWSALRWGAAAATAALVIGVVAVQNMERGRPIQSMAGAKTEPYSYRPPESASKQIAKEEDKASAQPTISPGVVAGVKRPQIRYEKVPPQAQVGINEAEPGNTITMASADGVAKKDQDTALRGRSMVALAAPAPAKRLDEVENSPARQNVVAMEKTASGRDVADLKQAAPAAVPPPPPPSANETVEVAAQAETVEVQKPVVNEPMAKGNVAEYSKAKVAKAPASATFDQYAYSAGASAGIVGGVVANPPQWQVTREGFLQKSFDRGQSWLRALPNAGFRAVAFIRNEVWAGGLQGVLMHSNDNGMSWQQVTPKSKDRAMQGDVTSIAFTDALHGTITTSAGETWTTSNGGKSWQKQ
jgi:hypothetical protein